MRYSFAELKYAGLKTVLISFLFHISLLSTFVFSFNTGSNKKGPYFVFLGSILQNQDMLNINFDRNKTKTIPLDVQSGAPVEQHRFTSIKKPQFAPAASGQKILFKTSQKNNATQDINAQGNKSLNINNHSNDYQPLRLLTQ